MTEKNDSNLNDQLPDSVSGLNGSVSKEDLEKINTTISNQGPLVGDKPWNKQFEDDLDEQGKPSRVAKNKKKRGVKNLVIVLFAALIILMFIPVFNWVMSGRNSNPNNQTTSTQVAKNTDTSSSNKEKKTKKSSDKKKTSSSKKSNTKKESNDSSDNNNTSDANSNGESANNANNSAASTTQNDQAANAVQQNQNQSANSTSQADSGYYTVAAGDNPFRIAYNHNMTTDELYALNGLQPGTVLQPGMRIKVK
ncbi:LysM peptidoglycan-binding domain-containing protein [Companilactobacillus sp. DQM5]|uniref:LysM peptidoglycan-binding domain-containing protein n=1 Tax=Companilactobacillus sp. DQM5 TaxID=3463359 RepID=UPI00405912F6